MLLLLPAFQGSTENRPGGSTVNLVGIWPQMCSPESVRNVAATAAAPPCWTRTSVTKPGMMQSLVPPQVVFSNQMPAYSSVVLIWKTGGNSFPLTLTLKPPKTADESAVMSTRRFRDGGVRPGNLYDHPPSDCILGSILAQFP